MAKLRRIMRKSLKARRRTSGATVAVLSHPLFFCAAGAARGGGARRAEQAPQLRQEYGNKTFFNIAILHRSLFFVNRAFMTLFDNLNIHFVVLGAGALQRKHIFCVASWSELRAERKRISSCRRRRFNRSTPHVAKSPDSPSAAVNRPSLVEKRCPSLAYLLSLCILPFRAIHFFLLSLGGEF